VKDSQFSSPPQFDGVFSEEREKKEGERSSGRLIISASNSMKGKEKKGETERKISTLKIHLQPTGKRKGRGERKR